MTEEWWSLREGKMSNNSPKEKGGKRRGLVDEKTLLQSDKIKKIVKINANKIKGRAITCIILMYAKVLKKDLGVGDYWSRWEKFHN